MHAQGRVRDKWWHHNQLHITSLGHQRTWHRPPSQPWRAPLHRTAPPLLLLLARQSLHAPLTTPCLPNRFGTVVGTVVSGARFRDHCTHATRYLEPLVECLQLVLKPSNGFGVRGIHLGSSLLLGTQFLRSHNVSARGEAWRIEQRRVVAQQQTLLSFASVARPSATCASSFLISALYSCTASCSDEEPCGGCTTQRSKEEANQREATKLQARRGALSLCMCVALLPSVHGPAGP